MICPECFGAGRILVYGKFDDNAYCHVSWQPCPSCSGFKVIHCCEGEQVQATQEPKDD